MISRIKRAKADLGLYSVISTGSLSSSVLFPQILRLKEKNSYITIYLEGVINDVESFFHFRNVTTHEPGASNNLNL